MHKSYSRTSDYDHLSTHKRPPLLSDQFSKIPKVTKSNHYIWNLLQMTTSRKQLQPLLISQS